jgi:soluble lytic murein transglycosylase-like protein
MDGSSEVRQAEAGGDRPRRRRPARTASWALPLAAFCLCVPGEAAADIVVFTTGRTMSVASARVESDRVLVTLREGGDASFPSVLIARVEPDEVAYPEAMPAAATEDVSVAAAPLGPAPLVLAPPTSVGTVPRARPFAALIATSAAAYGVDVRLVHAVIEAESNYQPRARSKKGAKGLMQLMPATARQYAVRDPYDPRTNIDAGVRHLKDLLTRFDVGLALAAYNAGEATVRRFGGLPPYSETRDYVSRILRRVGG